MMPLGRTLRYPSSSAGVSRALLNDDCLILGDPAEVAQFLGVSLRTLKRYQKRPDQMLEACKKLLRLRAAGDLRTLGGDAWDGFRFGRDGLLYLPGWRNGFDAHQVRALFFTVQEAAALRAAKSEIWALRKVRDAERDGSLHAKMQQHAEALRVLSEELAANLAANDTRRADAQF